MEGGPPNGQPVLPDDLIFEILTRLPVKSLLKFRCVSRSWLSVISSQEFIKSHLEKSDNDDEFTHHSIVLEYSNPNFHLKHCSVKSLLENPKTSAARVDYPGKKPLHSALIVGSCNGLICIVLDYKDLYLWNPCIGKSKKLPESGFMVNRHRLTAYGFGYNECNGDYNVVLLLRVFCDGKIKAVIYSLRTDSWNRIDDFPTNYAEFSGIFVNGKLHWSDIRQSMEFVSLDLALTEYGLVRFPSSVGDARYRIPGVLGKSLCVSCLYGMNMDLWVMKEYGVVESWNKIARIPGYGNALCISGKGEILMTYIPEFGLYNLGDNSLTVREIEIVHECYYNGHTYVESLVSPVANDDEERLHEQQRREWSSCN